MKISAKLKKKCIRYFLGLVFIACHFYTYGQGCSCPPIASCGPCLGGITSLTFRYNGFILPATVTAEDNSQLLGTFLVPPGGTFTVTGSLPDGKFAGNVLRLRILTILNATINTNCGTGVFVGSDYGLFTVMAGESKNGGAICCDAPDMDATVPVISGCPSNIALSLPSGCSMPVSWSAPTATDNCGAVALTSSHNSGDIFAKGTTVVTYTATDDFGNTATCSFNVTVNDVTNPSISGCPSNVTVNANASCQAVVSWTAPTVSDNCGGAPTLTPTITPGSTFNLGTTPVIYTATDASGNTSTCSFTVTVQDNTNPVITGCPSNITVNADASCQALVNWTPPTVSDNCVGALTLTPTKSPGTIFNLGTTIVIYTAADAAGNTSTCSFNVTVNDVTNPVISGCPANIVVSADALCQATVNWTSPTVSDNCGGALGLSSTRNPGTIFNLGTTMVTYTAADAVGNTSTCSFSVTVQDNTNPVITGCPSNITIDANGSCQALVSWTAPTATDNCSSVLLTPTKNPGTLFNLGTTAVTYTATDAAGNLSTCTFNVTVQDNTAPVIAGCPSNITINADATCQAVVNWTAPTVSDNCGGVLTFNSNKNPGTIFGVGTTVVTYTATDAALNVSTCSFNVIVQDVTSPVITGCPSNITVPANGSCQAAVTWTPPTATDNCGYLLTPTKSPGSIFSIGTTVVTYTATDPTGNTATCSFNVTVQDNTSPVITGCPSNITVAANGSCQAAVTWTPPTATDNCGSFLSSTKPPGSIFSIGTTVVTYTATDAAGNASTCSFNVTVQDNSSPVIAGCPSNITVSAGAQCQATVTWTAPTATDNCAGPVTLSGSKTPGSQFPIGSTVVTYTATDVAGNSSTCSFTVIVQDDTAPQLAGCSDIKISEAESCETSVSWTPPTATDCGTITMTSSHDPGDIFPTGTTQVTYTAVDNKGNTSTCSFNVIVEDKAAPAFSNCPSSITINANNSCEAPVSWTEPLTSDNCAVVNVTKSHAPGDVFAAGTTHVKYTATDAAGNQAVCEFNVTVKFETPPIITNCPENIQGESDENGDATIEWTAPTATAACGNATLTSSHQPGESFPVGITNVEYKAEDAFGNVAYCRFQVEVKQTEIAIDIGQIVTPDGNTQNDEWVITNIEKFGDNKVIIVDRWGGVVYSASGYNNESVVWRGHNRSGDLVPTGTYFYTISVRYGPSMFEKTGFIELIR